MRKQSPTFHFECYFLCAAVSGTMLFAKAAFAAPPTPASSAAAAEISYQDYYGSEKSSFRFSAGAYASTGTIGSKNNTILSRTVNSATGFLQIGHKSGYIIPFLRAEYGASVQSTDSSKVAGTNMSGAGYGVGAGLLIAVGSFNLGGAFMPFGEYDLSAKTLDGSQVKYSDPSVWLISAGYSFDSLSVFLVQKFTEFSRTTTGAVSSSLGDNKLSHSSLGGGVEWTF
jgi:hypothetical protein